jgi:hypothetical protein
MGLSVVRIGAAMARICGARRGAPFIITALMSIACSSARADNFTITYTTPGANGRGTETVVLNVAATLMTGTAGDPNALYQVTAITSGTSTQHTGTAALIPLNGSQTGGNVNWGLISNNGKTYGVDNYFRPFNTSQPFTTYQLTTGQTGFVSGGRDFGGIGFYFSGDNNAEFIGARDTATTDLALFCASRTSDCSSSQFNGNLSSLTITNPGPLPGAGLLSYLVLGFGGLAALRKRIVAHARDMIARTMAALPGRRRDRIAST